MQNSNFEEKTIFKKTLNFFSWSFFSKCLITFKKPSQMSLKFLPGRKNVVFTNLKEALKPKMAKEGNEQKALIVLQTRTIAI